MQQKSDKSSEFSERTDALAAKLERNVSDLPGIIRVNPDMLWGYRRGRYPISSKAWAKLEQAEIAAGIFHNEAEPEQGVVREEAHTRYGKPQSGETDSPQQLAAFFRSEAIHHKDMARRLEAAADLLDPPR
jgi:hypothetical protein